MLRLLAVAAVMILAAPAFAQEQPAAQTETRSMPIYSNALAPGWNNWSWANVTLGAQIADPAERPIRVEAQGWQALYLQHAPFNTGGYSTFSFWANGASRGGQVLQIMAIDPAGQVFPDRVVRVTLPAREWMEVNVPLAELGASNREVSGFWIQNGSPDPTPPFFVNEISLR